MAQPSFLLLAEQTIEDLMARIEAVDALADVDLHLIDGVLTVGFEDGSKLILNRQEPVSQLWLASPEGPAHFGYDAAADDWRNDKTGESLLTTLERVLGHKVGKPVRL